MAAKRLGRRVQSWFLRWGGLLVSLMVPAYLRMLHFRIAYYDRRLDPADEQFSGPVIYLFWHEYLPIPFHLRPHCHIALLISQHGDAELLSQAAGFRGYQTVRGSTSRGGMQALRQLMRASQRCNMAMTPDGPLGPRRQLAAGAIFLASRLGIPLVPIGIGYQSPWRVKRAWDQFAIPRPGSRARLVLGPAVRVPGDARREQLEAYRLEVQELLEQVTQQAERWAEENYPIVGAVPLRPQIARSHPDRW